jgi:hypothetical protein
MPTLADICEHYAFENQAPVKGFLDHHSHIVGHLATLVAIIKEHIPALDVRPHP